MYVKIFILEVTLLEDWFSQVFSFAVLSVTIHSASESLNGWVYVLSWTMVALLLGYTLLEGSQVLQFGVLYAREIVELVKVMYVCPAQFFVARIKTVWLVLG